MTDNQQIFFYWIGEREEIRKKKEAGLPKPWTNDKYFQNYKFCNVRREDDRVTKWIRHNWRDPFAGHPNMWFAMVVARLFNWPPTLEFIGFPTNDYTEMKEHWRAGLKKRREEGEKIFTGAYLVSTNGVAMDKIDYILDRVLTPIWERGRSPNGNETLKDYWTHLTQFDGLGSFMAGQVVADLKYIDDALLFAPDWSDWAPLGPGSIRGLNRFFGRATNCTLKQEKGLEELRQIQQMIKDELGMILPVHDVQNCCCETDKMIRLRKGEGKVRSGYKGV